MRFILHGGSTEEETALSRFAERLGAGFVKYEALYGEEPLLVVRCPLRKAGLLEVLRQIPQWMDGYPPSKMAAGAQDPLPGLDTPPCQ